MPSGTNGPGGASALPVRAIRARAPSRRRTQNGSRARAPTPSRSTVAAVALRAVVLAFAMTAVFTPAAAEDVRELQWDDLVEVVAFEGSSS